ncbi:NAD(P)H-binding protein [Brachybacterium sp. DNPG3]
MHHLLIGEGQIGREIVEAALAAGDTVTVLRRSAAVGPERPGVTRVRGDVGDAAVLARAVEGADAIHACFHAPYDVRIWRRELPQRERAVLDAAAAQGVPVVFPESMYGFVGAADDLAEGAAPSPRDAKGEVRVQLLAARRAHAARTLSIVAADLIGPTSVGTGASVAGTLVIEPIVAGRRAIVPAALDAPHSLTFTPDLARAMLHAARHADRLPADGILHAPTAPPRSLRELAARTDRLVAGRSRAPLPVPRAVLRAAGTVSTTMREIAGIGDLWYRPCRLAPGLLETAEGLAPTSWEGAADATIRATLHERGTAPSAPSAPSVQAPRGAGAGAQSAAGAAAQAE